MRQILLDRPSIQLAEEKLLLSLLTGDKRLEREVGPNKMESFGRKVFTMLKRWTAKERLLLCATTRAQIGLWSKMHGHLKTELNTTEEDQCSYHGTTIMVNSRIFLLLALTIAKCISLRTLNL